MSTSNFNSLDVVSFDSDTQSDTHDLLEIKKQPFRPRGASVHAITYNSVLKKDFDVVVEAEKQKRKVVTIDFSKVEKNTAFCTTPDTVPCEEHLLAKYFLPYER
eukprot:Pgem_evm1s14887